MLKSRRLSVRRQLEVANLNRRTIPAGLGTLVEWYDFSVYAFVAPALSRVFFPTSDPAVGLIATFGVFAAGYGMRALGAIVLGSLGDRVGRRGALLLSITIVSAGMLMTAVLPTHAEIGVWAAVLLVVARMIQGFGVGGEFTGAVVTFVEYAPRERRGLVANVGLLMSGLGVMLASGVVTLITALTTDAQMDAWGWRIPFGLGVVLSLVAFYMRRDMAETETFETMKATGKLARWPLLTALRESTFPFIAVVLLTGFSGVAYFTIFTFLPSYLETFVGVDHALALAAITVGTVVYAILPPFAGALGDRIGRRPMMFVGCGTLAVLAYPAFLILSRGVFAEMVVTTVVLTVLLVAFTSGAITASAELFPARTRYSGYAASYNVGNAALGSTAPLVGSILVGVTNSNLSPAFYLILIAVPALVIVARIPETARAVLANE
jgi:MFS transporter, MHS family, proline/betaine transporter